MKFVASHTYGAASGSEECLAQGGMRFRRSDESDEMERDSYRAPWARFVRDSQSGKKAWFILSKERRTG